MSGPVSYFSERIQEKHNPSPDISIIYEDQPYNDFKSLFLMVNGKLCDKAWYVQVLMYFPFKLISTNASLSSLYLTSEENQNYCINVVSTHIYEYTFGCHALIMYIERWNFSTINQKQYSSFAHYPVPLCHMTSHVCTCAIRVVKRNGQMIKSQNPLITKQITM